MPKSSSWPQPAVLATMSPAASGSNVSSSQDVEGSNASDPLTRTHRVLALYKFVSPKIPKESLRDLQSEIETACRKQFARGTLLLAEEGINGTICYPFEGATDASNNSPEQDKQDENRTDAGPDDPLLNFLQSKFNNSLRTRISTADRPVFARLKIKIKSEIVTMHWEDAAATVAASCNKVGACSPTELVGEYVKPKDWNQILLDPEVLVVDTRNQYEYDVGTFKNAINPKTDSFVEFPQWLSENVAGDKAPKKIAMFCTGGIRCEKATNACLQLVPKGVPVYHLEGGILAYLNDISPEESLFDGDCYVFDQRVAVTYGLQPSSNFKKSCHGCRHPLSEEDLHRDDYVEGISCRYCTGKLTEKQQERFSQRQRQIELALKEGRKHIHDPKEETFRRG